MKLEHYPVEKLKQEIKEIVGRHLDLKKYTLFFFGSRVLGKGDERSDIDLGIEGSKPVDSVVMSNIQEDIEELPMLYKIDIVDFKEVGGDFYKVAKEKIEIII